MNVFPSTLYSDKETEALRGEKGPTGVLSYFFEAPEIPLLEEYTTFTFAMLSVLFLSIGAVIARASNSWTPIIVVIICTTFVPMLTSSLDFFNKMLYEWDNDILFYLALALSFGVIVIALITIVETPTHGRSG